MGTTMVPTEASNRTTDAARQHRVRRRNRITLLILSSFVLVVTAYSALHIRGEIEMSTPTGAAKP
jgi:cell division protein FtsB